MSRYPPTAYRQLFPTGASHAPFDPAEDGDHYSPEPDFFEWWYFDVALDDGSYLVVVLHSSLYNAVDHKPTLDLRYYPKEGRPVVTVGRFDRSAYTAAPDRCWVTIGNCKAVDRGDHYHLILHHESLTAELTFWPQLPGWRAGSGHLFADSSSGRHFDWIVPLPRAYVEGRLVIAGQRQTVTGAGYHDHNWGNLYLPAAFSRWTWGRVLADDWTLVFGDVVGCGESPPRVTPLLLARRDEILLAGDRVCVWGTDPVQESRTGTHYFRRLHLASVEEPAMALTLTARRTIEALDFAMPRPFLARSRHLRAAAEAIFYVTQPRSIVNRLAGRVLGKGAYLRCEADFRLNLANYASVEVGQALFEVMAL